MTNVTKGLSLARTDELRDLLALCPQTPAKRVTVMYQGERFKLSERSRRLIEAELVMRGAGPVERDAHVAEGNHP